MTAAVAQLPEPARLEFVVAGPPVPKARARKGRGGHWYTPRPTVHYELAIRNTAMVAKHSRDNSWPKGARYRLTVVAYFPDRRRRDGDNVIKSVQDACNGMLWVDDAQVVTSTITKAIDRARPRTEVTVEVIA